MVGISNNNFKNLPCLTIFIIITIYEIFIKPKTVFSPFKAIHRQLSRHCPYRFDDMMILDMMILLLYHSLSRTYYLLLDVDELIPFFTINNVSTYVNHSSSTFLSYSSILALQILVLRDN